MDRLRVVLGVAGGIAAYKAVEVLRLLTEAGCDVRVVPTASALRFVGSATWGALSGAPVPTDVWSGAEDVEHVRLGRQADLLLVVPATADLLARAATGRADDLLTATLLTARCPTLLAPAMHTEMWQHPAVVDNVATLRRRGSVVLDPASGRLTGLDSGPGRLPEPAEIVATARALVARGGMARDLAARTVLVTAGGTREQLDPVRFLGNRSSGRQGWALARAAAARGATVTLVSAHVELAPPSGVSLVPVGDAEQMRTAVRAALAGRHYDAAVLAAAVADFRPASYAPDKLRKGGPDEPSELALTRTADILAEIGADRSGLRPSVLVGFAAETGDALARGRAKLAAKAADLLVVNEVGDGRGFEVDTNAAVILDRDGGARPVAHTSKDLLAHAVWDAVAAALAVPVPVASPIP